MKISRSTGIFECICKEYSAHNTKQQHRSITDELLTEWKENRSVPRNVRPGLTCKRYGNILKMLSVSS